jgi:hypothetical protein
LSILSRNVAAKTCILLIIKVDYQEPAFVHQAEHLFRP